MHPPKPLSLLLIGDKADDLANIKKMLKSSNLAIDTICESPSLQEAITSLHSLSPDVVLLDLTLEDCESHDCYIAIRKVTPSIPVIIFTGVAKTQFALQAIQEGAQDYLVKSEVNVAMLEKSIHYSIERMHYREQLRSSELKYRRLFDKNPFPSFIIDRDTNTILEVNQAAVRTYGYSRQEFTALPFSAIRARVDKKTLMDTQGRAEGPAQERFITHRKANGDTLIVEATYLRIDFLNRPAVLMQVNDITERVRLEQALTQERVEKRREMNAAVLEAQERERTAIGQELHDNVNQIITAARLYMDMVHAGHAELPLLGEAITLANQAIEENRKLAKALILPQLKGEGLVASLEELRIDFIRTSSLKIKFSLQAVAEQDFTESEKVHLYRIVQEQLSNIVKYAEARTVLIRLYRLNDSIILSIKDNGKGFNPGEPHKGVGLVSIGNRAKVLKGEMLIDSAPGKGCTLTVLLRRS